VPFAAPQAGPITDSWSAQRAQKQVAVQTRVSSHRQGFHFFLPEPKFGCHPTVFWLGAAAIVLIFIFGFFSTPISFSLFGHVGSFEFDS